MPPPEQDVKQRMGQAIAMPQNTDAEEGLLGALLSDPSALGAVVLTGVTADDFYIVRHGWLFKALVDLRHENEPLDIANIGDLLQRRGQLEEFGGRAELTRLIMDTLPFYAPVTYAKLVRRYGEERRLLEFHRAQAQAMLNDQETGVEAKWQQAMDALLQLRPKGDTDDVLMGRDSVTWYDRQTTADAANPVWFPLPWASFEEVAPVYRPGDIIIIAGPEGSGKSAMAFNMAQYYAEELGAQVLAVFTEMDKTNVLARRMAANSKLVYRKLLTPEVLTNNEWAEFHRADQRIAEWAPRVDYWECGATDAKTFIAGVRSVVDHNGTQVVIIDGMNDLLFEPPRGSTKADAIHNFMAYLETFAREHNLLVVGTVQLNRQGDALGSGAYKRKAALYMRIDVKEAEAEESLVVEGTEYRVLPGQHSMYRKAVVEKNRRGVSGPAVKLAFLGARFLWVDAPKCETLTEAAYRLLDEREQDDDLDLRNW